MSSFLQPFTGGQGSLRQAIMYDYNNKSDEKQRLKSKRQMQPGVPFSFSLLHSETGSVAQSRHRWMCGFGCYLPCWSSKSSSVKVRMGDLFSKAFSNSKILLFYILLCGHRQHGLFLEGTWAGSIIVRSYVHFEICKLICKNAIHSMERHWFIQSYPQLYNVKGRCLVADFLLFIYVYMCLLASAQ